MSPRGSISRRDALAILGGSVGTVSSFGTATGWSGSIGGKQVTVAVGFSSSAVEYAVRDRAHAVVYEFAFDALAVVVDETEIEPLRQRDGVRYVERNRQYEITSQTLPWGIDRVDAEMVDAESTGGEGADIAILDTGIDEGHQDLEANLGKGTGFQGGQETGLWQDDNGHGTHCSGIAAAVDNDIGVVGTAPHTTLHAVKVMAPPGVGFAFDLAKGIEWVADQGYDVASMSLGGDSMDTVADACQYAADQGVTLVAAAGNDGSCTDCVIYPAAHPEVIAVSSITEDDELSDTSSQGPEIDLAAPGKHIYSTYLGGYATLSGTSMACPHVSGAAARLAATGHSRAEIRQTLENSAEDVGLSANEVGAGLLDVAAAVEHDDND
jgi:subtilisin